jgi:hypothetical protein
MSLPALNLSGHIYFSTMPIITTTVIKDDENDSEIKDIEVQDGMILFSTYEPKKGFVNFALSVEETIFFIAELKKCVEKVNQNQS